MREFSTGCTSKTEAEAVGALRSPEIRDEGISDTRGRDKAAWTGMRCSRMSPGASGRRGDPCQT